MKKLKILLVAATVALVPLRALAAVTGGLCGVYGAGAAEHVAHHHDAASGETSSQTDSGQPAASTCSICTACCAGVTFVAEAPSILGFADVDRGVIPFCERRTAAPYPDELDRPPLSL